MISAPIILRPKTDWTPEDNSFSSDTLFHVISGTTPLPAGGVTEDFYLQVVYRVFVISQEEARELTGFTSTGTIMGDTGDGAIDVPWSLYTRDFPVDIGSVKVGSTLRVDIKTLKMSRHGSTILDESPVVSLDINKIREHEVTPSVMQTLTVGLLRSRSYIKARVPKEGILLNAASEFAGINFYVSVKRGGGVTGYTKMNRSAITDVSDVDVEEHNVDEYVLEDKAGDTAVKTIKTHTISKEYYTCTLDSDLLRNLIADYDFPNVFLSDGKTLDPGVAYYITASVMVYDRVLGTVVESAYAPERAATFLEYSLDKKTLPARTHEDIVLSMTKNLATARPDMNIVGGSVLRDIMDPVALEIEKFYVIQDFIFSAMSIDTLLLLDDEDGDGISDPVSSSREKSLLKKALKLSSDSSVQDIIDNQFDKFAANNGLTRRPPKRARGFVTFYVRSKPDSDIRIPSGITLKSKGDPGLGVYPTTFVTIGSVLIDASNSSYFYNPGENRYETVVEIEAEEAGEIGNVPAGFIEGTDVLGPGVQAINMSATVGGCYKETNQHLADRIKLSNVSKDIGTSGGYMSTVLEVPGVEEAKVEAAGSPLMLRDYDPTTKSHLGGKVDIYVKGERIVQTTDTVSFKYDYPSGTTGDKTNETVFIVSASEFKIKIVNSNIAESSPIVSVSKIYNRTRKAEYSLDGIKILNNEATIIIERNDKNKNIGMSPNDSIDISYRYRSSNTVVLSKQPARSIRFITDALGNEVPSNLYELVNTDDLLTTGRSTIANTSVRFLFDGSHKIRDFIDISDEHVVLLIGHVSYLNNKGVEPGSLVVKSIDGSKIYKRGVDYNILAGSDTVRTGIELVPNSMIRNGSEVLVSYKASMNFKVTYTYNAVVEQAQEKVLDNKNSCADVIVKQATKNYIDLGFIVNRSRNADAATNNSYLLSRIKQTISNLVAGLRMGDTLTQSSVVNAINSIEGVDNVELPLNKLMKRNGSFIPIESIKRTGFELYRRSSGTGATAYISIGNELEHRPHKNGAPDNEFRAIYENNIALHMVNNPADVQKGSGRGCILDDGRIVVSTIEGNAPQANDYKVSYCISYKDNESVAGDIHTTSIEYIAVDEDSIAGVLIR